MKKKPMDFLLFFGRTFVYAGLFSSVIEGVIMENRISIMLGWIGILSFVLLQIRGEK